MEIARNIDVASVLAKKSVFLFGPRQCGKSWLVDHTLKDVHVITGVRRCGKSVLLFELYYRYLLSIGISV